MKVWEPGPPLISKALIAHCQTIVVIPVRNEERLIARALHALVRQSGSDGERLAAGEYEIIVLLNNCTDGSQTQVEAFIEANSQIPIHAVTIELPPENANVGYVRRLLMDEACLRFSGAGRNEGAILSTDADTVVSPTWVEENRRALARGWDAVGGRIVLDPYEREALPRQIRQGYQLDLRYNQLRSVLEARIDPVAGDPWPQHHQHFCASLAVTAAAYKRVGGLPAVSHLEDVALWDALRMDGARLRHSSDVTVTTSARMEGRVEVGLSEHLRGLGNASDRPVESAALLRRGFSARRSFHRAWISYRRGNRSEAIAGLDMRKASSLSGVDPRVLSFALEQERTWAGALQVSDIEAQVRRNSLASGCSQTLAEAVGCLELMVKGMW